MAPYILFDNINFSRAPIELMYHQIPEFLTYGLLKKKEKSFIR